MNTLKPIYELEPIARDLIVRRSRLHAELTMSYNPDPQYLRDRVNEMAYINRELARLGVIPPMGN